MLAAELSVPGICVQVLDYRWSAGEEITEISDEHVLSYRSHPYQVSVAAVTERNKLDFGKLFFFPAGVRVGTNASDREEIARTVRCRFEPDWFARIWETSNIEWDDKTLARSFDMHNIRIEQAIQRIGAEAINPGFASPLMVDALSNVIAVEIARYFRTPPEARRVRTHAGKMLDSDLQRIYEYVNCLENKCPNIDDIAKVCDISAAHLRRSFKKATGRTVHDYVEEARLEKTKSLLIKTDLPLKEVAYRVGFSNLSTLSTSFKRLVAESPSEYRYRYRN
jgi:AraC family transcriptional regulator